MNAKDRLGQTPLYYAAQEGHLEVAKLLVSKAADVNVKGYSNQRPLHLAAERGYLEIAELLVSRGG